MKNRLTVSIGQHTDKGPKKVNQDFYGACIPAEPQLSSKGVSLCLADGISSSEVSQHASEVSVKGFIEDYYSTPDSWTVKTSVQRVLSATNSWLYLQTRNSPYRYNMDKGYVCTFTTLVIKSNTAHIFHAGDTRVYRVVDNNLEQLTEDHRLRLSAEQSYLSRALGISNQLELDYRSVTVEIGDTFILSTDGVYEFTAEKFIIAEINANHGNLDLAAKNIVAHAIERGSDDNLSLQIVRIDDLSPGQLSEIQQQIDTLPFPPALKPRMDFDGYEIVREIQKTSRSHLYLAVDGETKAQVVLKIPSVDLRNNKSYLEHFLTEEWVARRINHINVLKAGTQSRKRSYFYITSEYIHGKTLRQWILDNSNPSIEAVRGIIEQIASGLRAFHRQEMFHQDLRPENIMIDDLGTVKIIDFGSVRIEGIEEIVATNPTELALGTALFTAPECFLGEVGSKHTDMFSLGVICYQLLSGHYPYGTHIAKCRTRSEQYRLKYQSILQFNRQIPIWIDEAVRKAVNLDPSKRYQSLSEFIYDLRHPNKEFINKTRPPLIERNPVAFWKSLSLLLFIIVIVLIATHPALG